MGDTLNALQKIGGVPTLQSGDTVQVNPLAAVMAGNQAASGVYDLRAKQGQQLWGEALQQSTDENGNVDYPKAQRIAAGMGPAAAMAARAALLDTASLQNSQNVNTANHMKLVGTSAITVARDPSDANVNASFDNLIANGSPRDQVERERARWLAMSPAERQQNAYRVGQTALEQLHQVIGQTTGVSTGGQFQPVTVNQPTVNAPGSLTVGPGAANITLTPGEATALDKIDVGNGQTIQVPHAQSGALLQSNPGWRLIVGGGSVPAPAGTGGSQPAPTPPTKGQIPGAYQPPGSSPAAPAAPAAPSGVVMGNPAAPQAVPAPPGGPAGASTAPYTGGGIGGVLSGSAGPRSSLRGGVPVASTNALQMPSVGPPSGPNPLVPGDVAAIMAGMRQGATTPAGGTAAAGPAAQAPQGGFGTGIGTYGGGAPAPAATPPAPSVVQPAAQPTGTSTPTLGVSAPVGTGERVKADIDAYTKDAGAVTTHQGAINTLQNAYKALQLADTGPGTQNLQAARAFLQSFGIATSATGDQATQWAEAHKYLMDYARTQGLLGGTDLQAQLAQGSNASTDIPKPAALAVVRNNIAKERMAIAQSQEANGSTGYVDHTKNFSPAQDQRAYQADIMPPAELKQIEALQKTNPAAFKKFQKSLDLAIAHGLISVEDLAAQNQRIRALGR